MTIGESLPTIVVLTVLGLVGGLGALLLFQWWADGIDGFVYYDAAYEPLPETSLSEDLDRNSGLDRREWLVRIGLVVVPAGIGAIAGTIMVGLGWRLAR